MIHEVKLEHSKEYWLRLVNIKKDVVGIWNDKDKKFLDENQKEIPNTTIEKVIGRKLSAIEYSALIAELTFIKNGLVTLKELVENTEQKDKLLVHQLYKSIKRLLKQ